MVWFALNDSEIKHRYLTIILNKSTGYYVKYENMIHPQSCNLTRENQTKPFLLVAAMDADSSYGGSDTAQDSHSAHDPNSSLDTTSHHDHGGGKSSAEDTNSFYHKNEITLPINYDEADFQNQQQQPHYLATANLNINETLENHSNLEELSKKYNSTNRLNAAESPKRPHSGIDNPAFQAEEKVPTNGTLKSTFKNSELNSSVALGLSSPNKHEEPATEAVNLELINLKPMGKDVAGPYENGGNGVSGIPTKKETEVEVGNPYDEYFVPVNEHRKYMR